MKLLHLTFSPRGQESESTQLSQAIVDQLSTQHTVDSITRRDWSNAAVIPIDSTYANTLANAAHASAGIAPASTLDQSEILIRELEAADQVVIGTPMHNFTVPASLKTWIDLVVRVNRSFIITPEGKVGTLSDKPVYIAVASGGFFGSDRSRQPDFLTPYLKAILATIGLHDLRFISAQGMALGQEKVAAGRAQAQEQVENAIQGVYSSNAA